MAQTLNDVLPLVDQSLITAAKADLAAKVTQAATATAQVNSTAQSYATAQAALSDAAQGKGSVTPVDAAHQVEDAERARRVAAMVQAAATQAVTAAQEAVRLAEGKAWRGVYLAGARQRLAAARAADTARLALDAAQRDHTEGTRMLDVALSHGVVGVPAVQESSLGNRMGTEAEESRLWTSNGFDPVAGTYPKQWN